MSKGISGKRIKKVQQIDEKTLRVYLKSGSVLDFYADMCDYDDCALYYKRIGKRDEYDEYDE